MEGLSSSFVQCFTVLTSVCSCSGKYMEANYLGNPIFRAVDKIFVLGVLIWLPKAALLEVQCLA